jgi:hypothetical protein
VAAPYSLFQTLRVWRCSPVAAYQSLALGLSGLVLYGALFEIFKAYF